MEKAGPGSGRQPVVPDYELLRQIGKGGFGEVWLARNKATGILRAAKIVWRHTFEEERPFQREFEGISQFERISREHPSQLALFHIGRNEAEGYFYYVMELADDANAIPSSKLESYIAHTLKSELRKGPIPATRVVEIGLALSEALRHLHSCGLVHRDVKPSNVIFVNGRPKLADIGLVTDASKTVSVSLYGTNGYAPPGELGTPQADIYALGKVIYEAVTGLDRLECPKLPEDLRFWSDAKQVFEINEIVLKACASEIRNRYRSAEQMQADLKLPQQGRSIRRQFRWRKRVAVAQRLALAVVTLSIVAVASFAVWRRFASPYDESDKQQVNSLVQQGFSEVKSEVPDLLKQAKTDFEDAIRLDPTFVPAHWGLFQVAINNEEWKTENSWAHAHIQGLADKLKSIAPNRAESHTAAAIMKWMEWKFAEALAEDRAATQARPACKEGRGAALTIYGFHLLQTGHPDEAMVQYRMAERLDASPPITEHHLGHPYFVRGQFANARSHYEKSAKLEPRHWLAHYWIGRTSEEMGNFTNAISEFQVADDSAGRGEKTKAFHEALREALRQNPADPAAYWNKRLELALEHKTDVDRYYEIATLYARRGDTTNAYVYLKKACDKHAFSQGLLFDVCWDKSDTNFQAIVRGIGLAVPVPR